MEEDIDPNLLKKVKRGKYLKDEILAFSGKWLIVFDGRWNYMLFSCMQKDVSKQCENGGMPTKGRVEYYSTFDNALDNLVKKIIMDIEA